MTLIEQLKALDEGLLAALAAPDSLDEAWLSQQLEVRAQLLQTLIAQGEVSQAESAELIQRSRQLKDSAEAVQRQLGDKLKKMQKGRRSVGAYQKIKHQE